MRLPEIAYPVSGLLNTLIGRRIKENGSVTIYRSREHAAKDAQRPSRKSKLIIECHDVPCRKIGI